MRWKEASPAPGELFIISIQWSVAQTWSCQVVRKPRSHCSPAVVWLRSVQATVGLRALVPCPSSEKPKLLSVLSLEWIQILLGHLRCMFYKLPWSHTMWLDCEIVAIQRTRLQEKFVAVALVHSGWTRWVLLSRITSDLPVTFNTYQYMCQTNPDHTIRT